MLGSDILVNWDTTYSLQHFKPCKDFYGEVDMECNRQLPSTKFHQVPLIKKLVDQFCKLYPHLLFPSVDSALVSVATTEVTHILISEAMFIATPFLFFYLSNC